ncbi:rhomboid family intramembrane serine protease [Halegenticoccus soli]|uniref:rhomboid family intramembrane serine protease n=1 Tax=Halegenticoccus soli TaxID=1985678 RepID=UPI000C6E26FB|nr:rhomboid family intramembrane serine protease [Halegenticoccus soli]
MGRLSGSPTVETLVAFVVVFALQSVARPLGLGGLFVLAPPLYETPVALVLLGLPVEHETTRARFHAFFLVTGSLAALAEITVGALFAPRAVGVLGASGALFALLGYMLTGNPLSGSALDRLNLSRRAQLLVFAAVAVVITFATSAPRVALVAHFTGLLLGLVAGRTRLLRVR